MAIHSPNTGIVDFSVVSASYAEDLCERGGEVITDFEVTNPCVLPCIMFGCQVLRECIAVVRACILFPPGHRFHHGEDTG